MPPILAPVEKLALQTRIKTEIDNLIDRRKPIPGKQIEVNDYMKKYADCVHRTKSPCIKYNCHGLTFASRRTSIDDTAIIQKILEDDGYIKIELKDVLQGDIIIYRKSPLQGGEIEHSGIVVGFHATIGGVIKIPLILSKWGSGNEVIHPVNRSPYQSSPEYYRIVP